MEQIVSVKQVENVAFSNVNERERFFGGDLCDGYAVETTEQTIYVVITNAQDCCEHWGYLASEDDLDRFVGAELRSVEIVDKEMNVTTYDYSQVDRGEAVFVNFVTDRGTLQLVAYNEHNGYYGHMIRVRSKQVMRDIEA